MTIHTLYQCFFLFHITGFILFVGTTAADFIALKQFWKQYEQDPSKANAVWQPMSKFPILMAIGMALIIITAVGLMAITNGVFGEQLWLRIKFPIVITILHALLIRRRQGSKLSEILRESGTGILEKIQKVRRTLKFFHAIQLTLFFPYSC